jgi:uncharacterized protein (TIGR02284 family)
MARLERDGGGAGFSRFLLLAAGEGESRPASGPHPRRDRWLEPKDGIMANTVDGSNKNREMERVLLDVISSLEDGQKGFADIGEHLKDSKLKRYFLAESLKRANFRAELENELHRAGMADVKESGTAAGTVRRVWADLKAKMGAGDHGLLETAEQGEDEAVEAYRDALKHDLPLPIREVLNSQQAQVVVSHDFVKSQRDLVAR